MKKEPTLEQKLAKLEEDGDPLVVGDENPLPSLKSIETIDGAPGHLQAPRLADVGQRGAEEEGHLRPDHTDLPN